MSSAMAKVARKHDRYRAVERDDLSRHDQEMSRKLRSVLLSPDTTQDSKGIAAATLERSDRAGKRMLSSYIVCVAPEQFRDLARELHRSNADFAA